MKPMRGPPTYIFQLLIVAQVLVVAFFAIKWLPQAPSEALLVLALQGVVALAVPPSSFC
jgi:hypothetical protein